MFLSGGGVYVHADVRRTSIAAAVDFAAAAGLQGIILNTLALQVGRSWGGAGWLAQCRCSLAHALACLCKPGGLLRPAACC